MTTPRYPDSAATTQESNARTEYALELATNVFTLPNARIELSEDNSSAERIPIITEVKPSGNSHTHTLWVWCATPHVEYDNTGVLAFEFSPEKIIAESGSNSSETRHTIRQIKILVAHGILAYTYAVNAFSGPERKPLNTALQYRVSEESPPCSTMIDFGTDLGKHLEYTLLPDISTADVTPTASDSSDHADHITGTDLHNFVDIDESHIEIGVQKFWESKVPFQYAMINYYHQSHSITTRTAQPIGWLIYTNVEYIMKKLQPLYHDITLIRPTQKEDAITVHKIIYDMFHKIVREKVAAANRTLAGNIRIECTPFTDARIPTADQSHLASPAAVAKHVKEDFVSSKIGKAGHRPRLLIQFTVSEFSLAYADPPEAN